jgi:pyruvate,water dikinase
MAAAFCAGAGDRAPVRLQVQRVRQPGRRPCATSPRREPDDRVPRRLALCRRQLPPCFELECEALKRVREQMGLTNVWVMIPFVRTVDEARAGDRHAGRERPGRGENGLKVIMMCELPSNALLADQFLEHFDGFSIGSNDMTQLTLGLDRDSAIVARCSTSATRRSRRCCDGDRRPAARRASTSASAARARPIIRISPSGCSSRASRAVSLNPDTVVETWMRWRRMRRRRPWKAQKLAE